MAGISNRFGSNFNRFDRLVIFTLAGLALLTGLMLWRGDRVGAQVVSLTPPDNAIDVSTRSRIQVTFDQPLAGQKFDAPLRFSPVVSGAVRWQGPHLIFTPNQPLEPGTTYTVTLAEGLANEQGRTLPSPLSWQFQTAWPRLLYMSQDEQARDQLYLLDPTDNKIVQLTAEPLGVFDYEPSPDGATVAYAAIREDGGNDLWIVAIADQARYPLLLCPDAVCNGVAWRPDGARLVYERRNMLVAGAAPGPPRLWWLEPATGETAPVFEDTQIIGYGAGWSPDGQWLSYVAPASQGVQLYNVVDGRTFLIPSRMNDLPAWSPRENVLIVTDIQAREAGFAVHLLRARPDSGELVDLSGADQMVEDSSAAWSADGAWLIFTRKAAGAAMGKQLWLMRADGAAARYLTADPNIHHAFPSWSPDGRSVTFQSLPLKELGARPSIWLLEVETGQVRQLAEAAGRPVWLP